jgi:hypothetical protein
VRGQLEQIGDVGGVERLDQRARTLGIAILDRIERTNSGLSRSSSSSCAVSTSVSGRSVSLMSDLLSHATMAV